MKTITKFCLFATVMLVSVSVMAQQSIINTTSNTATDKQEWIQQMHGPTYQVPSSPGASKATGDNCSDPIVITLNGAGDLPYNDPGQSTLGRDNNYSETCLNDFDEGEDIIYKLELGFDTTLFFQIDPLAFEYSGLALNEQCFDDPTATCLRVSTDTYNTGEAHGFTVALEAGTYYIIVDNWATAPPPKASGFDLQISATAPVPNDDCDDAIEIGEVTDLYFNTEQATESAWPGDDKIDIWYKYTATIAGDVVVSLCDVFYDSYLEVYDVCNGTLLDDNDDNCGWNGLGSEVVLDGVSIGDEFIIRVTGYETESGYGYLNIFEDLSVCDFDCPPGGIVEGEVCGDDDNGECATAVPVLSTDSICGNLWAENDARDTDWYKVELTAVSNIKLAVVADEYTVFGMVAQYEQGEAGCDNLQDHFAGFKVVNPCIEDSIEFGYLPAGTYYFMVAPNTYWGYDCPGYDYLAAFTVEAVSSGTIAGTVTDGTNGIDGVVVTADVYSAVTSGGGTYSFDAPVGTYDVYANGLELGFSSDVSMGEVVTDGNTTTVDFVLNDGAPVLTGMADPDFSNVNLTWTPVPVKNLKGTDVVMGEVLSNNNYGPGNTMDLEFTLIVYAPEDFSGEQDFGEYFEITLPDDFTIHSASDFPEVLGGSNSADIISQTVSWDADLYFWTNGIEEHIINFTINVTVDGGAAGPQVADYYFEGDGYTGDPASFDGLVTIYEDGGAYVPTYNVYRSLDDGTGNEFIWLLKGIPYTQLYDAIVPGNWCYYVTQILENGLESASSDTVCIEVLDPCDDAIDYGNPGDAAQTATLEYAEQIIWFTFSTPGGDIQISTCGSDFDTQFALYQSCDDIPQFPDMVPDGALETATDGCDDIGQANVAYCGLEGGTYYLAVYGENDEIGNIEVEITKDFQCLTIYEGWGGFSTYIEPAPSDLIVDVLADMVEEMEITIRQSPYGIWWVPENINTIMNISPVIGYKSKMNATESTIVTGTEIADKTVNIPQGASYLPVRVPYPTDISDLETQLGDDLLIIYNIYNPAELLWPDGGLNLLPELLPDYAYQINVHNPVSFTYSAAKSTQPEASTYKPAPYKGENIAWNEVINTGNPHFISINADAMTDIMVGDLIGVFNEEGICVGVTEFTNTSETALLNAFGDDTYTVDVIEGMEEGEMMNFKLYRPAVDEEYALEVTWNAAMPNSNGAYELNGLSMITGLKLGPTDISESEFSNVNIFPNPSTGVVKISGLSGTVQVAVTNAQGQLIYSGDLDNNSLDLSAQSKGVYFIRLYNDDETMIQKVILK